MRRSGILVAFVALAGVACTEVGSDPNAVVAIRFNGSAYPSIVAGDSLRDSLGALQPLQAIGLNYRGEPVTGAQFVFSSPDTILRLSGNGVVFARGRKADATPTRVFATIGSLQSTPDSLVVVPRADLINATKAVDTITVFPTGGSSVDPPPGFVVTGDTLAGAPKVTIPSWLVSFQLKYRGALLPPSDTSVAFSMEIVGSNENARRLLTPVDTTDASGKAGHRVFVRSIPATVAEDTIFLIATIRSRKANTPPISAQTMFILRRS